MKPSGLGPQLAQEVGTRMQLVCQKRPAFVKKDGKKIRAEILARARRRVFSAGKPGLSYVAGLPFPPGHRFLRLIRVFGWTLRTAS